MSCQNIKANNFDLHTYPFHNMKYCYMVIVRKIWEGKNCCSNSTTTYLDNILVVDIVTSIRVQVDIKTSTL